MRAVVVRLVDADFARQMASIGEWLDRYRCEATRFVYDQADGEVVVSVEFPNDSDAEAFAIRFNGQSSADNGSRANPTGLSPDPGLPLGETDRHSFRAAQRSSLLRHPGLAQPDEIGGFEQGAGLRDTPISVGHYLGDARKRTCAQQSAGLGKFGAGPLGLAF